MVAVQQNVTQDPSTLWWSPDGLTMVPVDNTNPLPVTGGGGGGGNVIITGPIGQATDANSVAVTLSTNQTAVNSGVEGIKAYLYDPGTGAAVTYTGATVVAGPTAVGSAAANPPILIAGTANATATGNVQVLKVDSSGVASVNTAQVNGVTVLTGTGATNTGSQRVTVAVDSATIAGTASAVGHGTAAAALRVELPTDGTGVVGLAAGSAVIGHVIADSGSTTAVTGNVTVVQTTAANLLASVGGLAAQAASVSGNPVLTGGRGATANPTAVTDGQASAIMLDKLGKVIAVDAIRTLKGSQKTSISNSTAETTIVTAVAATFLDLYGLILANTGATTTKVDIRDTTGGSIITTLEVPTLETRGFMLPAGSGFPQTTVNTNWTAQCAAATTAMEVTALYVKNI